MAETASSWNVYEWDISLCCAGIEKISTVSYKITGRGKTLQNMKTMLVFYSKMTFDVVILLLENQIISW